MPTEKCGVWSGKWCEACSAELVGGWLRGAGVLVFEAGGGEGGRTGGGQLPQQGSPGLGGSLDEPVGANIPCLGPQRLLLVTLPWVALGLLLPEGWRLGQEPAGLGK